MLEQWIKENANMKDGGSVAVINDDANSARTVRLF